MNYALIFAGGVGSRMHSKIKPKQFLEIHGKPIIVHTIEHFERHKDIDGICVVCVAEWLDYMQELIEKFNIKKVKWLTAGGETALASQYNGLKKIWEDAQGQKSSVVLIHDGVRPLINGTLISACIDGVQTHGSAITTSPANETILQLDSENMIKSTIKRADCRLARAPQAFYLEDIVSMHDISKAEGKYDYIDSASMMLAHGKKIYTVEGPTENIKVTDPADFYICRALMDARENAQIYGV